MDGFSASNRQIQGKKRRNPWWIPSIFNAVAGVDCRKRLSFRLFRIAPNKIGILATKEHRSMTNYIEFVLLQHLEQVEKTAGPIGGDGSGAGSQNS